ncbi:MAG: NAD(P)/FAD-dependent oxidoreductase [Halioglobus sp.]
MMTINTNINTDYDVIIIGGGHNGMLCGAYLAKTGGKVLVLEKKHETGGGLVTEDFQSPYRFNLHATYMMMADVAPSHADLKLHDHSLAYITPDVQIAFHHRDGKALVFHRDPEKSAQSVAMFSESDAARFRTMFADFKEMCDEILIPATYVPAVPALDQIMQFQQTELGRKVAEVSEMTPAEIIDSYGFEHPRVKGALLYLATLWGITPDATNVGYLVPLWIYRMMNAALVRGGSHSLSSSVQGAFRKAGGEVKDRAGVEHIIMEGGRAVGVRTTDGDEYRAKAVVSTVNPEQTFLDFIEEEELPQDLVAAAKQWQWEDISVFTSHYGVVGPAPDYTSAKFNPDANHALMNVIGIESVEDVMEAHDDVANGRLGKIHGRATCTSQFDSLAAVGQDVCGELNTLRFETWAPYKLDNEDWDDVRKDYMARCKAAWQEYAPNLKDVSYGYEIVMTPKDIERRLINMKNGSFKQGSYNMMQMGYLRPNDQCSRYSTPVDGLYMAGAAVYPGGMILHGSGYNAAKVVAEDLGLNIWWQEPEMVTKAKAKQYLQDD